MRLILPTLFILTSAVNYMPIKEKQFQIQGVLIEDPPHLVHRQKRQFPQTQYNRQDEQKDPEQVEAAVESPTLIEQNENDEDPVIHSGDTSQPPNYLERPPQTAFSQNALPQTVPAPSFQQAPPQNYRLPTTPNTQPFRPPAQYQQVQSPVPQYQLRPQPAPTWPAQPVSQFPRNGRIFNDAAANQFNQFGNGGAILSDNFNGARYYYPPKQPFPLTKCFYNPTGYACCNQHLNDLIVETYNELDKRPKFHTCNVNALAYQIQQRAEKRFNHTFETIAAYDDFAQKIHFSGDLVCKVELGGKYMLTYATVNQAMDRTLRPLPPRGSVQAGFLHKTHLFTL